MYQVQGATYCLVDFSNNQGLGFRQGRIIALGDSHEALNKKTQSRKECQVLRAGFENPGVGDIVIQYGFAVFKGAAPPKSAFTALKRPSTVDANMLSILDWSRAEEKSA